MKEIKELNEIKKGDLFGIKLKSIDRLSITSNNTNEFGYNFCVNHDRYEKIEDQYLICMYLGGGLAREFYTSIILNVFGMDNNDIFYISENYSEFKKQYEKAQRNPLSIIMDDNTIYKVDNDYYKKVSNNKKYEKDIKLTLNFLNRQAQEKLKRQYNEIIENLSEEELNEEKSYNLKKTL